MLLYVLQQRHFPQRSGCTANGHGINYLPDFVREKFDGWRGPDGKMWPEPELVKMVPGDAVVVLHSCPHGASINESADPR